MKNLIWLLLISLSASTLAQNGPIERLKESAAQNKKVLTQYTWQEVMTLSVDGAVKRTTVSNVEIGPDGKPKKSTISQTSAAKRDVRGPLRKRIVERKMGEFKTYAKSVAELAHQYSHPDPQKLKEAIKQGNAKRDASPGPGLAQVTITNYLKANDSMTVVLDTKGKHIKSVKVKSYLDNPADKVTIDAAFAAFPEAGSHLQNATIVGVSKQLKVEIKNSDYKKR